ncbi:MAG TPA: hypothetical protein VLA48_02520 [Nitrososphaeraceae archaeon]|nr:hypothetical protein [Nitrososphaeraceae archaeon]
MKNIYLIPTDKPSRLFIIDKSKMFKPEAPYLSFSTVGGRVHKVEGSELYQPQNMYITSDEDIKDSDYIIDIKDNYVYKANLEGCVNWVTKNEQKIILTRDPLLIEHGVQKIDDEFLEWFIKNSDCEFVEVEKLYRKERNDTGMIGSPMSFTVFDKYKINIPKANIIDTWLEKNGDPAIEKQVAEQLELEEAGIEHCNLIDTYPQLENPLFSFKTGAKWMAEKMYSEEEMLGMLKDYDREFKLDTFAYTKSCTFTVSQWFENNKK